MRSTSPGRVALPGDHVLGHGHEGADLDRQTSRAIASVACTTAAAPAMSDFISLIEAAGLMVRPPESKVMPLPTSARWRVAPLGAYVSSTRRGGALEPAPTPRMPPQPRSASAASSLHGGGDLVAACDLLGVVLDRGHDGVGEGRRGQVAGRGVDPVAGGGDGLGDDLGLLEGGGGLGAARDRRQHGDLGDRGGRGGVALVGGEAVAAQRPPLGDRADQRGGVGGQRERDARGVGDGTGRGAGAAAHGLRGLASAPSPTSTRVGEAMTPPVGTRVVSPTLPVSASIASSGRSLRP